jgi:hypothetical protein
MAKEAPPPTRIRRESIAPPEEPDEVTVARLRERFETLPRIIEAWLTGSRLTPEDGSPSYETTDILLVLDPPLDRDNVRDLRSQIEELEEALTATGYKREPHRGWIFGRASPHEAQARRIYSRSN